MMSHNGIPKDVKRCYLAILSEKDTAFIFAPHPFQATFNLMTALKVNAIMLKMRSDPKGFYNMLNYLTCFSHLQNCWQPPWLRIRERNADAWDKPATTKCKMNNSQRV